MKQPLVTVLLPVYNGEPYLKEAIQSILDQSYGNFELLIVNDASTDHSLETIQSFSDPRIKAVTNEKNLHLIDTLNRGLEIASGSYIARMDQDDYSFPDRLEKQVAFLEGSPETVLVGTEAEFMSPEGKIVGNDRAYTDDQTIRLAMTVGNAFFHGSVMFRKEAALAAGRYRPEAYLVEDYDLWLRMAALGEVANIPEILYRWRLTPTGMSQSNAKKQRQAAEKLADGAWEAYYQKSRKKTAAILPENDKAFRIHKLAQLDIQVARGYLKRGQRTKATKLVFSALKKNPGFPLFYAYLLMAFMPSKWFFGLESLALQKMRSSRGY